VRSFHMVVSDRNANLAAPRRARISVLQVTDSSIMDKYLDLSTCSSAAPWNVLLCFLFFCSNHNLRLFVLICKRNSVHTRSTSSSSHCSASGDVAISTI